MVSLNWGIGFRYLCFVTRYKQRSGSCTDDSEQAGPFIVDIETVTDNNLSPICLYSAVSYIPTLLRPGVYHGYLMTCLEII